MGKKLAIKGHSTRGKEVIELLEMLGGNNNFKYYNGSCDEFYYYIEDDGNIESIEVIDNDFIVFTLEEFLERFPYKVGDEFGYAYDKITEMFWDEEDEIVYYKTEYSRYYVTNVCFHRRWCINCR